MRANRVLRITVLNYVVYPQLNAAIDGQIISSGAMKGIEIYKYGEYTVIALILEKI